MLTNWRFAVAAALLCTGVLLACIETNAQSIPKEIASRLLPEKEYKRARALDLAKMAAAADALKKAWVDEIRGSGR